MLLPAFVSRNLWTAACGCQRHFAVISAKLPLYPIGAVNFGKVTVGFKTDFHHSSKYFNEFQTNPEQSNASSPNLQNKESLVSTVKKYILMRRDYSKKYTANNTITAMRAMQQYMLSPSDLEKLPQIKIRSPYEANIPIYVYLEKDVEKLAVQVYGSLDAIEKERKRLQKVRRKQDRQHSIFQRVLPNKSSQTEAPRTLLTSGPGRVVATAVASNAIICIFKFGCFLSTRSASMFSEVLHSLADFCNQMLLLWGVNESLKKPDLQHPYGFGNMRHIMSLISGVGIFCLGCGVSIYHGVQVLLQPTIGLETSTLSSLAVLFGSALIESGSLAVAIKQTRQNAKDHELSFWDYVKESRDPSTNVVLLEDSAAILGCATAGLALGLTTLTGNPIFDGLGSIAIGGLLGAVSTFLITSNVNALIGKSMPQSRLEELQEMLEDDAVIRGVYDVKATHLNGDLFKFKAEIDFDGREITRAYLATVDIDKVLDEIRSVKTHEDLERVILRYGEQVIDTLGAQVDRLESELKKKNPDLRHIDLEVL